MLRASRTRIDVICPLPVTRVIMRCETKVALNAFRLGIQFATTNFQWVWFTVNIWLRSCSPNALEDTYSEHRERIQFRACNSNERQPTAFVSQKANHKVHPRMVPAARCMSSFAASRLLAPFISFLKMTNYQFTFLLCMHGVQRWVHVRGKCVTESKLTIIHWASLCVCLCVGGKLTPMSPKFGGTARE